jgi:hypothetical protein
MTGWVACQPEDKKNPFLQLLADLSALIFSLTFLDSLPLITIQSKAC